MAELDELLDDGEQPTDRGQGGYRIMIPGRAPSSGGVPAPAAGSEVQPPAIGDLMRSASGVSPTSPAPPTSPMASVPPGVMRTPGPADVPTPPTGANNQRRMDLLRQMGPLEKPTDPKALNPQTGKPMYRMGIGQRILGAVADFGAGFNHQAPPVYIGPGATNSRFAQTEGFRQKQLGGVKEELGEQEKLDTSEQKIYEDAVKQAYEGQVGGYREKLGQAATENADTRATLATSTQELNRTKGELNDFKANPPDPIGKRIAEADRQGLKGDDRKYYIANGKLKEGSDRAPTELEEWSNAFKRDNGRAPTADEIANRKSRTSSKADSIEKDKETELAKAEDKATKRIDKAQQLYKFQPQMVEQEKQAAYADLEKDKARIQSSYETRAKQNAPQARPASAAGTTGTPTKAATPAKAPPKPTGPASAGKVWVYDKQTGARGQIPQHQLAAATQGANAKYGTW